MFQRALRNDPVDLAIIVLSVTATLLLYSELTALGIVAWVIAYGALLGVVVTRLRPRWQGVLRQSVGGLVILTFAVTPPLTTDEVSSAPIAWLSMGFVLVLLSALPMIEAIAGYVGVRIANVPGLTVIPPVPLLKRLLHVVVLAAPALLFLLSRLHVDGWFWTLVAVPIGLTVLVIYAIAWLRQRTSRRTRSALPGALAALKPDFVVYWDAPANTGFQLAMWLPYLRRLDRPFFIMLRNRRSWNDAVAVAGDVPVVLAPTMRDVDELTVPSLRVAFYTNNAARNTHFVRFQKLTHIQLLHGESDKAPSYNPVTAMYDRVYVAGQAGQDRYARHGVLIDPRKFVIVGRPQVESILPASAGARDRPHPVALYAPTWRGIRLDSSYTSLDVAEEIVEDLLARGCAVMFRPHPWSYKDPSHRAINERIQQRLGAHRSQTGVPHVFGDEAERLRSVNDCVNDSDLMISDVSSVVGDFLYSLKPLITTAFGRDLAEFMAEFPLARAGYVITDDRATWAAAFDDALGPDSRRTIREEMREYYLGSFPADDYASGFIDAARRDIDGTPPIGYAEAETDGESD